MWPFNNSKRPRSPSPLINEQPPKRAQVDSEEESVLEQDLSQEEPAPFSHAFVEEDDTAAESLERDEGGADDDEEFEEEEEVGELHVQPEQDELKREWLWKSVVPTLTREGWTDRLDTILAIWTLFQQLVVARLPQKFKIVDSLLAQSIEWRSRSFETFLLGAVTVPLFDARVEEKRELKLSWAGVLFIFMLLDASHLLTAFTRILSHEGPIENFAIPFSEIITATVMRLSTLCGIYSFSPDGLCLYIGETMATFVTRIKAHGAHPINRKCARLRDLLSFKKWQAYVAYVPTNSARCHSFLAFAIFFFEFILNIATNCTSTRNLNFNSLDMCGNTAIVTKPGVRAFINAVAEIVWPKNPISGVRSLSTTKIDKSTFCSAHPELQQLTNLAPAGNTDILYGNTWSYWVKEVFKDLGGWPRGAWRENSNPFLLRSASARDEGHAERQAWAEDEDYVPRPKSLARSSEGKAAPLAVFNPFAAVEDSSALASADKAGGVVNAAFSSATAALQKKKKKEKEEKKQQRKGKAGGNSRSK